MKKNLKKVALSAMITVVGATTVFAAGIGYNFGPNNCLHFKSSAGTNLNGNWVEGRITKGTTEANNYYKMIYARSGAGGTYSDWFERSNTDCKHRDYGSFSDNYAETHGHWDGDADHTTYDK